MIIFDVDMNTLKNIKESGPTRYFYIEKPEIIELYAKMDDILFRYVYAKKNDDNDLIFRENWLYGVLKVASISFVNEMEWRRAMNEVLERLDYILEFLEEKYENVENDTEQRT